jgi:hypothetical protein
MNGAIRAPFLTFTCEVTAPRRAHSECGGSNSKHNKKRKG